MTRGYHEKRIIFLLLMVLGGLCFQDCLNAMNRRNEPTEEEEEKKNKEGEKTLRDFFLEFQGEIGKFSSEDEKNKNVFVFGEGDNPSRGAKRKIVKKDDSSSDLGQPLQPIQFESYNPNFHENEGSFSEPTPFANTDFSTIDVTEIPPLEPIDGSKPYSFNGGLSERDAMQQAIMASLGEQSVEEQEKETSCAQEDEFDWQVISILDVIIDQEEDEYGFFDRQWKLKKSVPEKIRSIAYLVLERFHHLYTKDLRIKEYFKNYLGYGIKNSLEKHMAIIEKQLDNEWINVSLRQKDDLVETVLIGERENYSHIMRAKEIFKKFLKLYNCPMSMGR